MSKKGKKKEPFLPSEYPKPDAMQQKLVNMFHPLSRADMIEHQLEQRIQFLVYDFKILQKEINELKTFIGTGLNKEGWIKVFDDFLKPAIQGEINNKVENRINVFNQKVDQLYEILGLGQYDNLKRTKMDKHLLDLKKDLMRINFFKILFDINEEEMRCLTKKIKKGIKGK